MGDVEGADESLSASLYPVAPDLVPVEPILWPDRLSQTLLRHYKRCPRSAYLYVKHGGGVKSHEMDRGTLAHAALERLVLELIVNGEEGIVAGDAPEDKRHEALSMWTGALVDEIRRERHDLVIPPEQADVARVSVFHAAIGLDVNPEHVLAVERKFVLELPSGWEVSVKADLVSSPAAGQARVDDYKTSIYMPGDGDWDYFQVKVGAVALLYGNPTERVQCPTCDGTGEGTPDICSMCGGRGDIEIRGERILAGIEKVTGRELYPRKNLRKDGLLHRNEREWTRLELDEFLADLDALGSQILERLESWVWPARKGSWCSECPAESECPLPARLRGFEGVIRDRAHADELWEWSLAWLERAGEVQKIVKAWAKAHGDDDAPVEVIVGDEVWTWKTTEGLSIAKAGRSTDWDGLLAALERAAELGEPFDQDRWIKRTRRTEFKKSKRDVEVVQRERADAGAGDVDPEQRRAERFGEDAPW